MRIEEYFQFLAPDDIRLAGSRIGIETILTLHLKQHHTADEIAAMYPTITTEEVYATILFYHHQKDLVTAYLEDFWSWSAKVRNGEVVLPNVRIIHWAELENSTNKREKKTSPKARVWA